MRLSERTESAFTPSGADWRSRLSPPWRVLATLHHQRALWLLLAADLAIAAVHILHHLSYHPGLEAALASFHHRFLSLEKDGGLGELFEYAQTAFVVLTFWRVYRMRREPIHLCWAALFGFVLLDDSLELHERVGGLLVSSFGLVRGVGDLRAVDLMEPVLWLAVGLVCIVPGLRAVRRSKARDVAASLLMAVPFAGLVLSGGLGDMLHAAGRNWFTGSSLLFTLLEDGGELVWMSVACATARALFRHLAAGPDGLASPPEN